MARYAHLYGQSQADLEKARRALAKAEHDRESYRRFIHETGRVMEYMIWWAKDQGFSGETLEAVERAFAAGDNEQRVDKPKLGAGRGVPPWE